MKALRPEDKAALAAFAITALVFLPTLGAGFVFDDGPLIVTNDYVKAWHWLPRAFTTHLWDVSLYNEGQALGGPADVHHRYYRPLVTVSYLFDWMIGGGKPWMFHLTNTVLHAVTAGLATRAAMRWTASTALGLTCGATFALHPTRTENVTWVAGRPDILMLFFVLLAVEAFAAFERRRSWKMFTLGTLATIGGILSKEPAVMLPFVLLAERALDPKRSSRVAIVTPAVLCGAYLVGRALFWVPEGQVQRIFTPGHFLLTVGIYFTRIVAPWPPTMYFHALESDASGAPIYSRPLIALGAVVAVAYVAGLVIAWRRARAAFWLLVAAAAFMGPLLNVYFTKMNVSAQDRFLYAPLLFVVGGLVVLARARLVRFASERIAPLILGGAALAATFVIEIRNLDYRNNQTFWEAELAQSPDHPYGLEMLAILAAERGDLAEAYDYFTRSERPEARKYRLAVGDTLHVRAHFQRAAVLAALLPDGRVGELAALLDELWRLVDPSRVPARGLVLDYEIGRPLPIDDAQRGALERSFHWDIALLATRLGDYERAGIVVDRAPRKLLYVSSNPLNGALVLARLGRFADAKAVHDELRRRAAQGKGSTSAEEIAVAARQLASAVDTAAERDRAATPNERALIEAGRLAGLGAYLAALRSLDDAALTGAPDAAPFVTQLLVACRLEDAARSIAQQALAPERAAAVVADIAQQLPARLRDTQPVEGSLESVLARWRKPK